VSEAPAKPSVRNWETILLGVLMLLPGAGALFLLVVMFGSLMRDHGLAIFMTPLFLLGFAIAGWGVKFIRRGWQGPQASG
jgi:hypothetical protein